jgi:hypothetical protein
MIVIEQYKDNVKHIIYRYVQCGYDGPSLLILDKAYPLAAEWGITYIDSVDQMFEFIAKVDMEKWFDLVEWTGCACCPKDK